MTETVGNATAPYKLDEVAEALRVSRSLVHRLIQTGEIKAFRVGRHIRVTPEALQDFKDRAYEREDS